ncbi:uncharacterized protein with PIN domain [Aureimonas pseudogalii]|uniref:Uncharacterized protein with PIN domain n=1 Tax=Aureimonas pseudogalii TaxID=1744844 RepID=A0A7W6H6Y6_9HYPH|nr:uncharacterized protein with PIN domain [Aureimonas pseudogalii]
MIVVDTSALMAILLGEREADACMTMLEKTRSLTISTATAAEALIVANRRGVGAEMQRLSTGSISGSRHRLSTKRNAWQRPMPAGARVCIRRA